MGVGLTAAGRKPKDVQLMAKLQNIAIAGAGIAGVSTAIALARHGASISLFERADEIQEVGAGLQIGPNAARALEQLSVWDAVRPITNAPEQIVIRDGQTGKRLTVIPLKGAFEERFGRSYRVAHRADLLHALLQAASSLENIKINTGTAITGINNSTKPELVFENRTHFHADVVIGADGLNSTIRKQLFAQRAPPCRWSHDVPRTYPSLTGSRLPGSQ